MKHASSHPAQLADEHRALEVLSEDLVNRAESGDFRECDAIWDQMTRSLEAHMELEEKELFPRYAKLGPDQAELVGALIAEHAEVRSELLRLGLAVQEQLLRADDVRALVAKLRAHAAKENAAFYQWAKTVVLSKPALSE
jgi:hemerythrin-like domain-containing protein